MPLPQFSTLLHRLLMPIAGAIAAVAIPAFANPAGDSELLEVHLPVAIRAGQTVRVDQLLDAHYELPLDDYLLHEVIVEADVERRKRNAYAEVTVGRTRLGRVPLRDHATAIDIPPIRSTRWQLRLGPGSQAHGLLVRLAPATGDYLAAAPGNVRIIARSRSFNGSDPFYRGSGWGYRDRGFGVGNFNRGCPDRYHWRHGHSQRWYRSYNRQRQTTRPREPATPVPPIEQRQWRGRQGADANEAARMQRAQRAQQTQQAQRAQRAQQTQRARIRTQDRSRPERARTDSARRDRAITRRAQAPRRAPPRSTRNRATRNGAARRVIQ